MAAGTLPEPGKVVNGIEIGPCLDEACGHKDCAETRARAAMVCPHCDKPIGYETLFYRDDENRLVHAVCYETAVEAELAAAPTMSPSVMEVWSHYEHTGAWMTVEDYKFWQRMVTYGGHYTPYMLLADDDNALQFAPLLGASKNSESGKWFVIEAVPDSLFVFPKRVHVVDGRDTVYLVPEAKGTVHRLAEIWWSEKDNRRSLSLRLHGQYGKLYDFHTTIWIGYTFDNETRQWVLGERIELPPMTLNNGRAARRMAEHLTIAARVSDAIQDNIMSPLFETLLNTVPPGASA